MNKRLMGNVLVTRATKDQVLASIDERMRAGLKTRVYFVNAHCYNIAQSDASYRQCVNEAELAVNDGIGLQLGGKVHGISFTENLNGTDLTPHILTLAAERGWRVFFFGGRPGVAEAAARRLAAQLPGLIVAGATDGYASLADDTLCERINAVQPDIVIVALGVPLQEKWIDANLDRLCVRLAIGVGAYLDFASGSIRRAPVIVRRLRMEWAYRLLLEPKRLWRRYLIGNLLFLYYIFRWKVRMNEIKHSA